jgi:hypothetical protein
VGGFVKSSQKISKIDCDLLFVNFQGGSSYLVESAQITQVEQQQQQLT